MKSRRNGPRPRERLLASATNLFTTEGIRVIGIDRVLREADVAKASLYSLFGSKDALVIAYLQNLDEQEREKWRSRTAAMRSPEDKILAFFDLAIEEQPAADYRGSHFQNAVCEYPRPENEGERGIVAAAMEHRRWCLRTIAELLSEKNGYPGMGQAQELLLFLDGGLTGARLSRDLAPLELARELAKQSLGAPPADYSI
ncbi:MAG: TetR/AcrR family transcriptional regulator [Corynebacterium sp.]|nr:TetR/AcrR family transcriptional regulator [Corynebacterium sp.]